MALQDSWEFTNVKGNNESITVVEWTITWTDPDYPGMEVKSAGITQVSPVVISTATPTKVKNAVILALGNQLNHIKDHISQHMANTYLFETTPEIQVTKVVPIDLRAYTANKRWEVEIGGITFGGVPVATDDRSKTMIIGARIKAKEDPTHTKNWKSEAGFVILDSQTLIAIADAVEEHVQNCFDKEAEVLAGITDKTIKTTAQIDAKFAEVKKNYP